MLSECLRYELSDQGISVVCVKPGPVVTPIWDKSRQKSQDVIAGMPAGLQQLYGPTLDKVCCDWSEMKHEHARQGSLLGLFWPR
jgi:NAD(P)-dependent dehydrogenase (short-subunit alcohol dehydrogenase family)